MLDNCLNCNGAGMFGDGAKCTDCNGSGVIETFDPEQGLTLSELLTGQPSENVIDEALAEKGFSA